MERKSIIKIGIVISIVIIGFIWGFNYLKGINVLRPENWFYAVYDQVDGLMVSSPIIISGYKVGQVRKISFLEEGGTRVLVSMSIGSEFNLKQGSIAHLQSTDLMGTKAIAIKQGTGKEFLKEGDTLASSLEQDLMNQLEVTIAPIKEKAEKLLSSVDSVMTIVTQVFNTQSQKSLSSGFSHLSNIIFSLESTLVQIDGILSQEKGKLSNTMTHLDSISGALSNRRNDIENIVKNLSTFSNTMKGVDLKTTVDNLNIVVEQLALITNNLNKGDGTAGQILQNKELYNNLNDASKNLNLLIKDIQQNPKRYIHISAFGGKE